MATTRWKPGTAGNYRVPENWSDGAPGPGDTVVVSGARSSVLLYAPGNDPRLFSPNPAPPGETVAGQTLLFQADAAATASAPVQATLSNSTLAADTSLEASGPGMTELLAWFDNRLAGRIAVAEGGELRLTLLSDWPPGGVPPPDDAGLPTTTSSGSIEVGPDAEFWLRPLVGGSNWYLDAYGNWILINPFTGFAFFTNTGRIAVAPGADFLDRGLGPSSGLYFHEFRNDGAMEVHGAAGKQTSIVMDANLRGSGSILLDGDTCESPARTQLALFGPLLQADVTLRNASLYIKDAENFVRAWAGRVTFADERGYVFLEPSLIRGPSPGAKPGTPAETPSLVEPFGCTIRGFRAGNTIAIRHSFDTAEDSFAAQWDQAAGRLTVLNTTGWRAAPIAQFLLEGDYAENAFQVTGAVLGTGREVPGFLYDRLQDKPQQIDITTTEAAG